MIESAFDTGPPLSRAVVEIFKDEIASFGYRGMKLTQVAGCLQDIIDPDRETTIVDFRMINSLWLELQFDTTLLVMDATCMSAIERAIANEQNLLQVKVTDIASVRYKWVTNGKFVRFDVLVREFGNKARVWMCLHRQHAVMMHNSNMDVNELPARLYNGLHMIMMANQDGLTREGFANAMNRSTKPTRIISKDLVELGLIKEENVPTSSGSGNTMMVHTHPRHWFNRKMDLSEPNPKMPAVNASTAPQHDAAALVSRPPPMPSRLSLVSNASEWSMPRHLSTSSESSPLPSSQEATDLQHPAIDDQEHVPAAPSIYYGIFFRPRGQ
ncbi:hypothetical protein BC940DRAFT_336192 [Gongronella butleri]|nr:hypothetical protein BC940DRAFT_336192 [Gongronella butleri]